jgi:hypothetical protein
MSKTRVKNEGKTKDDKNQIKRRKDNKTLSQKIKKWQKKTS